MMSEHGPACVQAEGRHPRRLREVGSRPKPRPRRASQWPKLLAAHAGRARLAAKEVRGEVEEAGCVWVGDAGTARMRRSRLS